MSPLAALSRLCPQGISQAATLCLETLLASAAVVDLTTEAVYTEILG